MKKTSESVLPPPGTHVTFRLFADSPTIFGNYPPPHRIGIVVSIVMDTLDRVRRAAFAEYDPWDVGTVRHIWVAYEVEEFQTLDTIGSAPEPVPNDNQLHDGHTVQ